MCVGNFTALFNSGSLGVVSLTATQLNRKTPPWSEEESPASLAAGNAVVSAEHTLDSFQLTLESANKIAYMPLSQAYTKEQDQGTKLGT